MSITMCEYCRARVTTTQITGNLVDTCLCGDCALVFLQKILSYEITVAQVKKELLLRKAYK